MNWVSNQSIILEEGKGVYRYAMVDKDSIRGIKRRDEQTRDPSSGRHSLGDTKKDIITSGAAWLSDTKTPPQAQNWPLSWTHCLTSLIPTIAFQRSNVTPPSGYMNALKKKATRVVTPRSKRQYVRYCVWSGKFLCRWFTGREKLRWILVLPWPR